MAVKANTQGCATRAYDEKVLGVFDINSVSHVDLGQPQTTLIYVILIISIYLKVTCDGPSPKRMKLNWWTTVTKNHNNKNRLLNTTITAELLVILLKTILHCTRVLDSQYFKQILCFAL